MSYPSNQHRGVATCTFSSSSATVDVLPRARGGRARLAATFVAADSSTPQTTTNPAAHDLGIGKGGSSSSSSSVAGSSCCGHHRAPSTPSTHVDSTFAESICSHSPFAEGSTPCIPFAASQPASIGDSWSQAAIDAALDEANLKLAGPCSARTAASATHVNEAVEPESSPPRIAEAREAAWWPSPRLTMDPEVGVSIAQAESLRDEHRHLRCLRSCLDTRVSRKDQALEELSREWNSCYLRLSAQRLLEAALSAARSGAHRSFVETQLRGALREARSAGLGELDELVQRAQGILEEQEAQEEQEARERERREAAQDQLSQVVTKAYDSLNGARSDLAVLVDSRLQLVTALSLAQDAGLPAAELREAEACRRKVHHAIQDLRGQVRVICHLRPLNSMELRCAEHREAVKLLDSNTVEVPEVGAFSFDGIYAEGGTLEEIFEDCRDLIQSAVDGHNATIFSYGQTGAGKTYTMTSASPEAEGLTFRVIDELFAVLGGLPSHCSTEVSASMFELYNSQLVDLLRPMNRGRGGNSAGGSTGTTTSSTMSSKAFTDLSGIRSEVVKDRVELRTLLKRGLQRRAVSAHATNVASSRSHLIFTIQAATIDQDTSEATRGKIVLCDLAGSERLKKSLSQGVQRHEAIEINKSLAALGKVIEAAAGKRKQVPYREHKLTQILQDSIGGTAKTIMIVNCSPAASSMGETLSSLRYGQRARRIVNSPARRPLSSSVASDTSPQSVSVEAGTPVSGDFERSSEASHPVEPVEE